MVLLVVFEYDSQEGAWFVGAVGDTMAIAVGCKQDVAGMENAFGLVVGCSQLALKDIVGLGIFDVGMVLNHASARKVYAGKHHGPVAHLFGSEYVMFDNRSGNIAAIFNHLLGGLFFGLNHNGILFNVSSV